MYPPGWIEISPTAKTYLRLDASVESPEVWATDLEGTPQYYDSEKKGWVKVDKPSQSLQLAVGKYAVYAVDKNNDLFIR